MRKPATPQPPVQPPSLPGQLPLFNEPEPEATIDEQLLAAFGGEEMTELADNSQGEPNDPNNRVETLQQKLGKVIKRGRVKSATDAQLASNALRLDRDIYPINAPGMPLPGPELLELATMLSDDTEVERKGKAGKLVAVKKPGLILSDMVREIVYASGHFSVPVTVRPGTRRSMSVVSGHLWKSAKATGPVRADVMVIGKMLGSEEKHSGRLYSGRTGDLLQDICDELGVETDADDWYMTNLMKIEHPEAATGNTTIKNPWVNEWLPILHQELRLVQPKYILCLGADALKAMLGKNASVTGMEGRVVEYSFPISRTAQERQINHTSLLMACMHPAAVLHAPEQEDTFKNGFARFYQLTRGMRPDREEEGLDHRAIETLDELKALAAEIDRDIVKNRLALDAEWHGEHPQNAGAYLRTIQVAWKPKTAVLIHLRHPGGKWRFKGTKAELLYWLRKIFRNKRIVGQFLTADLEWLYDLGLTELGDQYNVPDTWEETYRQAMRIKKPKGGFDTGLALHAVRETGDFGLTAATLRHTTAPRYDVELVKWRDRYCNERGFKKEDMEGYGECPDEVIVPYGCYDADVTWRLVDPLEALLTRDGFGNNCWEAFWRSMRAQPGAFEMSRTGILVDRDRMDRQTETYLTAKAALQQKLRDWIRWPDMNFDSVFQVREFLFGEELNGKKRLPGEPPVRLRPPGARSLKLTPTFSTDKRPMPWEEVLERGLQNEKSPSTNKIALAILAQENQEVERWHPKLQKFVVYDFSQQVTWLRDLRFISQVLKSVLRTPVRDEDTQDFIQKDGYYVYPGGLPASICDDGVVRTHLYQTKETGRWSSARPPLQNLSKKRETDYARILGDAYIQPLRTFMRARPGNVLMEADYTGAELFGMAMLSGDEAMIEHARRNILPENHPDYYDIHSNVAKLAFRLDCAPTKGGLGSVGKKHMRIVAKSVVFGVAYGRGAKAIALAAKEEGVQVTVAEAQQVIDAIFEMYPRLQPFFESCKRRAVEERWMCGVGGRFRRFPLARDRMQKGDMERQGMNFLVQNMVAETMNVAIDNLLEYRRAYDPELFRMLLQIHDAILLEVPLQHAVHVYDEVLPLCMSELAPIYPVDLTGQATGAGPYRLGIGRDVNVFWGQEMFPDDLWALDLPPRLGGWIETDQGFVHPEKEAKIWIGDRSGGELVKLPS
jgi:uracil-DNA glycosylase family 4